MSSRGKGRGLLDERLTWPWAPPADPPWRLGHGLAAVGPGWWPLVRAAFAAVAETPGASVRHVRQKCCLLDVSLHLPLDHPRAEGTECGVPGSARPNQAGFRDDALQQPTRDATVAHAWARDARPAVIRAGLGRLADALREASRARCEACGRGVPPVPADGRAGRNHCAPCAARFDALATKDARWAEVRLWERHAGGVRWPPDAH